MCAGAVLLLIFRLRNGFQGLGAGGVIVRAHARLIVVLVALPGVVILGVLAALWQRVKEIQKGEADDAKNY